MAKKKSANEVFGEPREQSLLKTKEAAGEAPASVERPPEEETSQRALREKIEAMDLQTPLRAQAKIQAQDLASMGEEAKVKKLLEIAAQKGVVYAVHMAKEMRDPYLLDRLHDTLAEKGYYKKFIK